LQNSEVSPHPERIGRVRALLSARALHGVLVTDMTNVRYLCGFTGTNGLLVVAEEHAFFITDSRYTTQAASEVHGARVVQANDLDAKAAALLEGVHAAYVGFEGAGVTAARHRRLESLLAPARLEDLGRALTRLRLVKSPSELAMMRSASAVAEKAFTSAARMIAPGVTEREVALHFHVEALKYGADALSFDTIIAGGERGALPHGAPSERKFRQGDLVVFDFGVKLDGYCSDQTMTIAVGEVDDEARRVYDTVLAAQRAALKAVKHGVALSAIDNAARALIKEAGWGANFGHGTGHGIGMEIHELPVVGPRSREVALEGMVFTVEPGVYLPGRVGVRIEDTVAVTREGCEFITSLPKDWGALRL